jgi:hypothetical protein
MRCSLDRSLELVAGSQPQQLTKALAACVRLPKASLCTDAELQTHPSPQVHVPYSPH